MNKEIPSLSELKSLRKPLRNATIVHKESFTKLEKFAVWVTEHIGTMGFFFLMTFWTFGWLFWNMYAPIPLRFDPYPAFVLWLFISNVIQLLFLPLIMVGQNLEGRYAEARDEADFEINVRAEREIETILLHLEHQGDLILKILSRLEDKSN
jgi:uncharacterized membrane protein